MNTFEQYRPLLFGIAYRMLGSVMEAEDMVQETYLRYEAVPSERIATPKAFLCTVITRLCLDHLKSARAQRETYVGPWLPEPLLTEYAAYAAPAIQMNEWESLSTAFLVLLENLSPLERAVFLLREVFDYEYGEIAQMIGREEAACRQLFSRAKKHIVAQRPRFESTPEAHREMMGRFLAATQSGDLNDLMSLLAEDVSSWADGGGKTHAATRPVYGRERVARYLVGLASRRTPDITVDVAEVNGRPAVLLRREGKVFSVIMLVVAQGQIQQIHTVVNPEKLAHLNEQPASD